VGVVYRSPNASEQCSQQLNEAIHEMVSSSFSHVLIVGDFNYPAINWLDQSCSAPVDHPSHKFLNCVQDTFLYQHVVEATRYRIGQQANMLDLVFTNEEAMVSDLSSHDPLGGSDHVVLTWQFNCYTQSSKEQFVKYYYKD
jgi:endonuclease/exonuclease/phosphatase family metal-dependent hydrolase